MMLLAATLIASAAVPAVDGTCAQVLAEVARAAAARGWQAEARCVGRLNARLPVAAALTVQPLLAHGPWRSGTLTLTVRGEVAGKLSGMHSVLVRVTWVAPAWIATRTLAAGDVPMAEDLRVRPHRWADGLTVQAAEGPAPQRRLRRAVRQGEVLSAESWLPPDGLLRGDRLEAVLASGGVEIRTPVTLLAQARVGERVRVQPVGRTDVLDGVLTDHATVQVQAP
jgi:flagella basal body P-ring formation protein FlgA